MAQIRAARSKFIVSEDDKSVTTTEKTNNVVVEPTIQEEVLNVEQIRNDKLKQETKERELEEKQAAKLKPKANDHPKEDLSFALSQSLSRSSLMTDDEDD